MTTPQDPFGPPPGDQPGAEAGGPPPGWGPPPGQQQPGQPGQPPGQQWGAPGGQPPYGAPGGYGSPAPYGAQGPKKNGLGVAALVLGILAVITSFTVVLGVVLGLLALVLGLVGRGRAKRGEADNGGVALTGAVLGGIGLLLSLLIAVTIGAAIFGSEDGRDLIDCLSDAGNDQDAIEQCQRDLEDSLTP